MTARFQTPTLLSHSGSVVSVLQACPHGMTARLRHATVDGPVRLQACPHGMTASLQYALATIMFVWYAMIIKTAAPPRRVRRGGTM